MDIEFIRRKTNGITLYCAELGPTNGPLVFLLHGFPEYWYGWRHHIAPLARAGFRVVAPDQRGYGESDKPKGIAAYDLDVLAADMRASPTRWAATVSPWWAMTGAARSAGGSRGIIPRAYRGSPSSMRRIPPSGNTPCVTFPRSGA